MIVPTWTGVIIDLIVALVLVFSLLGGMRDGAVKALFGLLAFIISLPLTGIFIGFVLAWMGFVPDPLLRDFFALLATMGIILIVVHLVLLLPRNLLDKVWNGGFIWNVMGGIFAVTDTALGMVLMVIIFDSYPVLGWLNDLLASSFLLNWLVSSLGPIILSLLHATGMYLPALHVSTSFYAV